jgi:glycosyltransferase involved in cell wall biosynthesis
MNASPTRVLFVLPSLVRAGAETQVVDLVNALDPARFEKHLLTFESNLDLLVRIDLTQIKFYHCPRKSRFDLDVARQVANIIDNEKIDLVHCSLQIALFMGWLGIRFSKRKPPLVLAVHTTVNVSKRDDWFDKYLYQWLMRGCRKVIFVCRAQEIYWQGKFPFLRGKSQVIYNGVDTDFFDPTQFVDSGKSLRKSLGISVEARVVCHLASFRPEKGHTILLTAFASVLKLVPNAHLILAGDGPLRSTITGMVQQLGLEQWVHFLGSIADVRPVLAASDVSVLASTSETFSIAMLESMAMQVPMVATDMGGTSEAVLQNETGLIVQPGNRGEFTCGLASLLGDEAKRGEMGQAARKLVQERFAKQGMIVETSTLIEQSACG